MKIVSKTAPLFLLPLLSMGIVFAQVDDTQDVAPVPENQTMMQSENMSPENMMMDMDQQEQMSPEDFQMMRTGGRAMTIEDMQDMMKSGKMNCMQQANSSNYSGKDFFRSKNGFSERSKWGHENWGIMIFWKLGKIIGGAVFLFLATFIVRRSWDFAGKFPKKK